VRITSSYRLGTWFGIAVNLHVTFLLLLGWIGLSTYAATNSPLQVVKSVLPVVALFGLVVLHEYGHALTARHFGIRTRHITLYPIGGVAALEGMPSRPREQLLVALAGPAVNFALAALIAAALWAIGHPLLHLTQLNSDLRSIPTGLIVANLMMGSFNLLPALPMDGGRVLRALLAMRMDPIKATRIAANVAKLVALAMGLYALYAGHTMLAVIAVVVWLGSSAETRLAGASRSWRGPGSSEPPDGSAIPPTEVLRVPFEASPRRSRVAGEPEAEPRSRVFVDGMWVELVQTEHGPRMRYSRAR
jgi:Zn-dependent protease